LDEAAITAYIAETCPGTNVVAGTDGLAAGDTFFIYDPDRNLPDRQQLPFATIVTKDYGDFDNASNLNRDGVFRLNIGVSRGTYRSLFDDAEAHDFTALDRLMPHPVYGSQSWICVLNPSAGTFERLKPLLREAYQIAVARLPRRGRSLAGNGWRPGFEDGSQHDP
jgi:hypothetical protein